VRSFVNNPNITTTIKSQYRTRRKRLSELLGLLLIGNSEGIQIGGGSDLELGGLLQLLDADGLSIRASGSNEKLLNLLDLTRLW